MCQWGRSLNKISTICWWIFPLVARIWFLEILKGPLSKALTITLIFLNQILRLEYVIVYIWPNAHKSYKKEGNMLQKSHMTLCAIIVGLFPVLFSPYTAVANDGKEPPCDNIRLLNKAWQQMVSRKDGGWTLRAAGCRWRGKINWKPRESSVMRKKSSWTKNILDGR